MSRKARRISGGPSYLGRRLGEEENMAEALNGEEGATKRETLEGAERSVIMSEAKQLRDKAQECRTLANSTSHRETAEMLRKMAVHYDDRAHRLEADEKTPRPRG